MNTKNLIPKAKDLIPYAIYLLGLIALLVTVHEPKQTLNASPHKVQFTTSPSLSKAVASSPSADKAN